MFSLEWQWLQCGGYIYVIVGGNGMVILLLVRIVGGDDENSKALGVVQRMHN